MAFRRDESLTHKPGTTAPKWFLDAIEAPVQSRRVRVQGASIHYLLWGGDKPNPGLLLVHGGGAHAYWWAFIAPLLHERFRVAAIDLSGMGDSEHRSGYSHQLYVDEMLAVCEDAGFFGSEAGGKPYLCGHSLGGFMTFHAAKHRPRQFAGAIVLDSPVRPATQTPRRPGMPRTPHKTYPDREAAISRFRLIPPQECANEFIIRFIAEHSIKPVANGYSWKYDYRLFDRLGGLGRADDIAGLELPVCYVYGAASALVTAEVRAFMRSRLGPAVPMIAMANAHHHLLLDQPLVLAELIEQTLCGWLSSGG